MMNFKKILQKALRCSQQARGKTNTELASWCYQKAEQSTNEDSAHFMEIAERLHPLHNVETENFKEN